MQLLRLKHINNFILEQESTQEKVKDLQAKTTIEKEMMEIDKTISDVDLAIANLAKREKDGSLPKSESLNQQAIELQKKVAAIQKKSIAAKKMESLEK
jgi:hypothetical protein